jgi:hypothetical protein
MRSLFKKQGTTRFCIHTATKRYIQCSPQRPCRRHNCDQCQPKRRRYITVVGAHFTELKKLNTHCGITAIVGPKDADDRDAWMVVNQLAETVSRALRGRIGPFIRVSAVSYKSRFSFPHLHFIIQQSAKEKFLRLLKRKFANSRARIWVDPNLISDAEGLLGYLFDQNYLPAINDPSRIKGRRVWSGSRGLSYGFPNKQELKKLYALEQRDISLSSCDFKKSTLEPMESDL